MSDTEAPPAPAAAEAAPEQQAPAPAAPAPVAGQGEQALQPAEATRSPRRRGVPAAPAVIAVGNSAAITTTAAYQAAGTAGMIGAAGALGVAGLAAAAQRRRTVRRRTSTRAGRLASPQRLGSRGASLGSFKAPRSSGRPGGASAGGAPRSRGASGAGRGASLKRGGSTPRSGASTRGGSGSRSGLGPRGASSRGALGSHRGAKNRRSLLDRLGAGAAGKHGRTGASRTGGGKRGGSSRVARAARALTRAAATPGSPVRRSAAATRRAAQRTSRAAAPHLARAARATGRAGRAAGRALLAGAAGLGVALLRRSWSAGWHKARHVWRHFRDAAARRAAAKAHHTDMTGPAAANMPAPVAPFVRRPATTGAGTASHGGTHMSGHHFLAPAMEMARVAAAYQPDGMMQVGRDFGALPDALEQVADAMKISTARADAEDPLDPQIVEIMHQVWELQMKAAELSRELKPAFAKLHGVDIARLQNPRKGATNEAKWDVSRNADASL